LFVFKLLNWLFAVMSSEVETSVSFTTDFSTSHPPAGGYFGRNDVLCSLIEMANRGILKKDSATKKKHNVLNARYLESWGGG